MFVTYFETVDVEPGSRWDKRITLGVGCENPLTFTAGMLEEWVKRDPTAPTRARVFIDAERSYVGDATQLRSTDYLGFAK